MKYMVGTVQKPAMLTVEASTIRQAIVLAANELRAGVSEKVIFGESYARVTFYRSKSVTLIVQWAIG